MQNKEGIRLNNKLIFIQIYIPNLRKKWYTKGIKSLSEREKFILALVEENILYLGMENGVYTLTNENEDREIENYVTTIEDEFGFPQMQKILNKRGCVADIDGKSLNVYIKTDNNAFSLFNKYKTNGKEYIVIKAKKKKWKTLQFKFQSKKPFTLYSCTAEAYIGGYIKR